MNPVQDIPLTHTGLAAYCAAHFAYYNTLEAKAKTLFVDRCLYFIINKEILGAGNFRPGNHVKAAIAASAVQLTLGLETWELDFFDTIILHETDFKNNANGLWYKGETNLAGYVQLSWCSFLHGYKINNDRVNLGIHEFTHALRFNSVRGNSQDYFVEYYFDSWLACAYLAFADIVKGRQSIFRKYGGANINEFMSVCIEHFFEAPHEIKGHYPLLYYSTAALLNQLPGHQATQLNVRHEMLTEKNKLLRGFTPLSYQLPIQRSTSATVLSVLFIPLFITLVVSGILSGTGILFMFLFLLFYLRFDFKFRRFHFKEREFVLERGFFLSRWQANQVLPLSSLVSFRKIGSEDRFTEWEVVFYDNIKQWFYKETIYSHVNDDKILEREIQANYIAFYHHQ